MTDKKLRIVFAGTPDFAAKHLAKLIAEKHQVVACYTQPDRPAGRGKKLQPSAVKMLSQEHQIPVFQPESFKDDEAVAELQQLNADLMIVVAYGLLLPKVVLDTPRLGCINVHGSILPKWRGAAPIQRSVLEGDLETGVTIMQMDEGLDTGDMLLIKTCAIEPTDTSGSIYNKLEFVGPDALIEAIDLIAQNNLSATAQNNEQATYAKKLTKQEAEINWQDSAEVIDRKIRGYQPWPVAFTNIKNNPVKIWQASFEAQSNKPAGEVISADKTGIRIATGNGVINITQLQPPGKKAMSATDFLNGRQDWVTPGSNLLD